MAMMTRRALAKMTLGVGLAAMAPSIVAAARPRIVVVGGGAAGASVARRLAAAGVALDVMLVEANPVYSALFGSNRFLAGIGERDSLDFRLDSLSSGGIEVVNARAEAVDGVKRQVVLADGRRIAFDRAVVAPGIDFRFETIDGLGPATVARFPHAYKLGSEVYDLKARLESLPSGGTVAVTAPERPYRCTPAPYERASMMALYLKRNNPEAKVLILDSKVEFPLMDRMIPEWETRYGEMIEWVSADFGGRVTGVDPATGALVAEDETFDTDLANVIPPQRAGDLAVNSGLADESGWCPVDPVTLESALVPGVHVIGDAIDAGDMSKSGHAANSQAKVCAAAVTALVSGKAAPVPAYDNDCYFLIDEGHGLRVGGEYVAKDGRITGIKGYSSDPGEDDAVRRKTAEDGVKWYRSITGEIFGPGT